MDFNAYHGKDGLELGGMVRRGEVTALELLETAIARAEAVNPKINAIVYRGYEQARAAARSFKPAGQPFAGVPLLLKDITGFCAGMPTRSGSAFVPDTPASADSHIVAHFKRAGFIPFAKTNVPEFGLPPVTESKLYGPARNPWDVNRTPGGSSGGSAAAVAAGVVPVAHSSDGGGSIRIPAACCGLVGLKPTRGRNSLGPDIGDIMSGLVTEGVVSRTVRDTAAVLDATSGYMPGDPYAAPPPARPFLAEVSSKPRRLRIAFTTRAPYGAVVDPEIAAAAEATAKLCERLGHQVTEAGFDIDAHKLGRSFLTLYGTGLVRTIDAVAKVTGREPQPADFEAMTWNFYDRGRKVTGGQYLTAVAHVQQVARAFAGFFEPYDIWLTPTLGALPLPVGLIDFNDPHANFADPRIAGFALYNSTYNLSGQPAISLPLQQSKAGLPIGMLFGARYAEEATLLQLAGQLEEAQPWIGRKPAVR
ncbi:MAG TPA: amidase family protein [Candidatus Saccharimonadales bacterium]|jgi:amidase|nr:amidase family protein [Candidatus Saccharimonadales bacterium]